MMISTLVLALVMVAPQAQAERGPMLLDFHADWCPPCRQMRPVMEGLERRDYPVRSIDVDENPKLAERYGVENLPSFIVVDGRGREIARKEGAMPAAELTRWLDRALQSASDEATPVDADRERDRPVAQVSRGGRATTSDEVNPKPWATVVRITVHDRGQLGYGSGTVIKSTPDETIVLTCAHIFHIDRLRKQPTPEKFPLPVSVELFDGVLGGPGNQTVRPVGRPMQAEVIDYDFDRDVGLVRFKPGRVVPAALVVPPTWSGPKKNMLMFTVGCSHGKDATAWNTLVTDPNFRGLDGKPGYEATQCQYSPKQGRSGGGLFTEDGYVAGVCNFAFHPKMALGLYASPASIRRILDKNGLEDCYNPRSRYDTANLASRGGAGGKYVRGADPDAEDGKPAGRMLAVEPITVPPPEIWGVGAPGGDGASAERRVAAVSDRGTTTSQRWKPSGSRPMDTADTESLEPEDVGSTGSRRKSEEFPTSAVDGGPLREAPQWKPLVVKKAE